MQKNPTKALQSNSAEKIKELGSLENTPFKGVTNQGKERNSNIQQKGITSWYYNQVFM